MSLIKKFGKHYEFSIWVDYYCLTYKDNPEFIEQNEKYELGGSVYFWANEKNLFEFRDCGPDATYGFWDLTFLVRFFCSNLIYHISDDPFPVETQAVVAADKMNEVLLVEQPDNDINKWAELDWSQVDMDRERKIDSWNCRHGMRTNDGGSFLPNLFICRVKNKVEISWQNDFPHESVDGKFYNRYKKGVEYIDVKLYKDTVVAFCLDFINRFKDKRPELMEKYRKDLQKAIDYEV